MAKPCLCVHLPAMAYREVWRLQSDLAAARHKRTLADDIILLVEHPAVFTLGRRGGRENLTVSEAFLAKAGIEVIHIERGGNITFHGPGQLVCYPIMDIKASRLSVKGYVDALEEVMIRTASDFDVIARRRSLNRGVWVGDNKLGSIGIALRRWISFHGFAFNIDLSTEPFQWMHPCGLAGIGITTLAQESPHKIVAAQVYENVKQQLEAVLDIELKCIGLNSLLRILF
jgi:lipoate-protein ligase B